MSTTAPSRIAHAPATPRGTTAPVEAARPTPAARPIGKRVLYLLLSAAFVGAMTTQSYSAGLTRVVAPFSIAVALQFLPLFWRAESDPFEAASISGIYGSLGLGSSLIAMLERGRVEITYLHGLSPAAAEELVAVVGWAYVLGTGAYLLGYYSSLGRRAQRIYPKVAGLAWSPSRLLVASMACLLVAVPVYAYFQSRLGTSLTDVTHLAAGKAVWRDDPTQTWILRGIMLGLIPPMLALIAVLFRPSLLRYLVVAAVVGFAAILVLRCGQRGIAIYFLVTCGMLVHYLRKRIPIGLVLAGLLGAVVVSNVLLEYRVTNAPDEVQTSLSMDRFKPTRALSEHEGDRQRLATMGVVFYTFPDKEDFLLGESWLAFLVAPVPRWLWPDKAKHFIWRETYMMVHLIKTPVPVPYLGLLYSNFSWVGIVIGMFLWGALQRGLYEWLVAAGPDPSVALLYANLAFVQSPTIFGFQQVIQFGIPIYLILLFVGLRARTKAAAGGTSGAREVPA